MGYGFDSISATINTIHRIENEVSGLSEDKARNRRQGIIREVDERGIIATPANSSANELVVEAARISILRDGDAVRIDYSGTPRVVPR